MLDSRMRAFKDRLLAPVVRAIGSSVHPHTLTAAALASGLAAACLIYLGAFGPALALWIVNRALDGLDGAVARARGTSSDLGGYLDILGDFAIYAAIPIAQAAARPELALGVMILLGTFYVNAASWIYLAAVLERRGRGAAATGEPTTITMPVGMIEGTETLVLFALAIGLPTFTSRIHGVMALLVGLTVLQRLMWARRAL